MPDHWVVELHDKALLKAVATNGLQILSKIKNNEELGFKDILVSKKKLLRRVENLCYYFKENMPKYKNSLKKIEGDTYQPSKRRNYGGNGGSIDYSTGKTRLDNSKPITACKVEKDSDGNIKYPIIVT